MRNLWHDSGLSVIVLPNGEEGDRLYQVAKLWTELRMISPAIWIRPELLKDGNESPPEQKGLVLGPNSLGIAVEIEVDLFEQLASQPLTLVRLLVVRTAQPNVGFDAKQDALADLISQYLDLSLPTDISSGAGHDISMKLVKLNLIAAPTEFTANESLRFINPKFNANFIASPEDRATPNSGDAFVRILPHSLKFAGFTMMHVATLGALWEGLPLGTYELVKPGVWLGDKAFISRVFLSAILTDGLARRASSRVLDRAADAQSGFVDLNSGIPIEGTYPISDNEEQGDSWVNWMVAQTFNFDNKILEYKKATVSEDAKALEISIKSQLGDFPKFAWDKLLRVPYYAYLWLLTSFIKTLNSIFQGGDKGSSVIKVPSEKMDARDQILLRQVASVAEVKRQADAALISPVTPSHTRSTPDLWSKIRKLVFGMLDGANLDQFGVERAENGWPVFYRVSAIFNDPSEKLQIHRLDNLAETEEVAWSSAGQGPELISKYQSLSKEIQESNNGLLLRLLEIDEKEKSLKSLVEALSERLSEIENPDSLNQDEATNA
jgi:hypothetical protein